MPIWLWRGDFGSGKTGGMSWRLSFLKARTGQKLYCNYGLKGKDGDINRDILEAMGEDLRDALLGGDEIHIILEARGSGSNKKQQKITYFITQTRKRSVELHCTTQALFQVDVRLRNNLDIIVDCKTLGCNDRMKCKMRNCLGPGKPNPLCGWYEYNMYDGKTGAYKGTFYLYGPRDFDNLYDTEETITDFERVKAK